MIEQAFGQLKRRFSCLHAQLRLTPEKACSVILTCIILHNICKDLQVPDWEDDENYQEYPEGVDEIPDEVYADACAYAVRDYLANNYFA